MNFKDSVLQAFAKMIGTKPDARYNKYQKSGILTATKAT